MKPHAQGNGDELLTLSVFAIAGFLIVGTLLVPYAGKAREIATLVAWLHIKPFAEFAAIMPASLEIPWLGQLLFRPAIIAVEVVDRGREAGLTKSEVQYVQAIAGRASAILYAPLLFWLAGVVKRRRPDLQSRTRHDLESLIRKQAKIWPEAKVMLQLGSRGSEETDAHEPPKPRLPDEADGNADSCDLGHLLVPERCPVQPPPFEPAMRPEIWLKAQGFASGSREGDAATTLPGGLSRRSGSGTIGDFEGLDIESVSEALELQLGKPWVGFADLFPSLRALCAVFALFYNFENEQGQLLLGRLAELAERQMRKGGSIDQAIGKDRRLCKQVGLTIDSEPGTNLAAVAARHAWETTAFIAMLNAARKDRGVLASASFIWLKREFRPLWYALNNAGNAAIMIEAAGAHAHYRAERQLGCPLFRPAVFQASRSLVEGYLEIGSANAERRSKRRARQKPVGQFFDELAMRTRRESGAVATPETGNQGSPS